MSARVSGEVWEHSRADGIALLVLLAIADQAGDDGVTWLQVESRSGKKSITSKARCSRATAFRAVEQLVESGELQVVKVRRGASFINVYRVVVGRIAGANVDYDRLPFALPHPFGAQSHFETVPTVSSGTVQGLIDDGSKVSSGDFSPLTRSRSVIGPSGIRESDPESAEAGLTDPSLSARERLQRHVSSMLRRRPTSPCSECGVGGGNHVAGCAAGRETSRQAYQRFVDETAADQSLPIEEIELVIASWGDVDDVERQELLDRAAELRATPATGKRDRRAA